MSSLATLLVCAFLTGPPPADDPVAIEATCAPGGLEIDRGDASVHLIVPRDETLEFDVVLDIALIGETRVGGFELASGVEPVSPGLPEPGGDAPRPLNAAWMRGTATGSYLTYELRHVIETRVLPQRWPHVLCSDTQSGSENRRRELKYGLVRGKPRSWYRSDRHCKGCDRREHFVEGGLFTSEQHCEGCKRAFHRGWKPPVWRDIPEGTVDMLSAVFLARAMVREGMEELTFPLLDKTRLWDLTFTRGEDRVLGTPAGSFACTAINLATAVPAGEEHDAEDFKGLFGIHGSLRIWLESKTGVPVLIEGTVPAGPLDLSVSLVLREFSGTPPAFKGSPE